MRHVMSSRYFVIDFNLSTVSTVSTKKTNMHSKIKAELDHFVSIYQGNLAYKYRSSAQNIESWAK